MTVEKLAWIVGVELGTMFESQEEWAKKIRGKVRVRRIYRARNLVCLVLYDLCGVSHGEITKVVGNRHLTRISRGIQRARAWVAESADNAATWERIKTAVLESIAAEKVAHAEAQNLKVSSR